MNWDAFTGAFESAADEYSFSQIAGAEDALRQHRETFFTEADIEKIASTGINALRIPIGYWAYDNVGTPYISGADVYLERAIGWARRFGMKVWIDLHGSPGSQNGFDNSGQSGTVSWQVAANLDRSTSVLKTMAQKYGKNEFADVVVGLQMVNEPISWGNNDIGVTQQWAKSAYREVKAVVENKALEIVMHDAFNGAPSWIDVAKELNTDGQNKFSVDSHLYQLFVEADNSLDQSQHIAKACGWAGELSAANAVMPTYVGEWSAATNICVNPDGSTTPGTECSADGCQCQSVPFDQWNEKMIEQVRRFIEAQLDTFEANASGYFMWSAKGPGGWGFLNLIGNGAMPNPVTSRKFPGQCGGRARRSVRGSMGMKL
jgi:glucan 1,3-beta-glucosidase